MGSIESATSGRCMKLLVNIKHMAIGGTWPIAFLLVIFPAVKYIVTLSLIESKTNPVLENHIVQELNCLLQNNMTIFVQLYRLCGRIARKMQHLCR